MYDNPAYGDLCPHCEEDYLDICRGVWPYSEDNLQCPACDATYALFLEGDE